MSGTGWGETAENGLPPGLGSKIRAAQSSWAESDIRRRLRVIAAVRRGVAGGAERLAQACARVRGVSPGEAYSSELLPLADACRFLERESRRLLQPRRLGRRGRPLWLSGVSSEVIREPFGRVLILAPSNYPLLLAGVQALQALVAGNAVLVKPAPGCSEPLQGLAELLEQAGLPDHLCTLLPEPPAAVSRWIRHAADLVLLTGGVEAGRAVLRECAEWLVPCIVELSGIDSFHVLRDADLGRVADAIAFGLRLNGGRTCIAPRRILVQREAAAELRVRLGELPGWAAPVRVSARTGEELRAVLGAGAAIRCGEWLERDGAVRPPLVLEGVPAGSSFWSTDHFAPIALFAEVNGMEEAIRNDRECPFALGASIFARDLGAARALARRLPAGVVTINDTVAPTADPRLPFGGARLSGFGVTRGAEGLVSLTRPRAVTERRAGSWVPHFEPAGPERDRALFEALHGAGWRARWAGFLRLTGAVRRHRRGHTGQPP